MRKNWKTIVTFLMFLFPLSIPLTANAWEISRTETDTMITYKITLGTLEVLIGAVIIAILILMLVFLVRSRNYYKNQLELYESLYEAASKKVMETSESLYSALGREAVLSKWQSDAKELYSEIDAEIAENAALKEANSFSKIIEKDIPVQYLETILGYYEKLSDGAKKYVDFDPEDFLAKLKSAKETKSEE